MTPLQQLRLDYQPKVAAILKRSHHLEPSFREHQTLLSDELKGLFPTISQYKRVAFVEGNGKRESKGERVGVLFSGGQAPGGHNVVAGLFDELHSFSSRSQLIGFVDGPKGLIEGKAILLDQDKIAPYRNQGGFHLLGSGRTKIETPEQFEKVRHVVEEMNLDGIVIIGGDDSNTNGAYLAEYFNRKQIDCQVIGVPKTIDGDLKGLDIEISFGFDTASKVYSGMIGNLGLDVLSAKKMWAFVKLMGRSASHLTLECAMNTHPNLALIGEEIARNKKSLEQVVGEIADLVVERSKAGKNYGLILIPEGIIEFLANFTLPKEMEIERDPHGNVQVAKIETERLLITLVRKELEKRGEKISFSPQPFFFGYEARAAMPTNFDSNYGYNLGLVAALGISQKLGGRIAALHNLHLPVEQWEPFLTPFVGMMDFEMRNGERRGVITKTLVDLEGHLYHEFKRKRVEWRIKDDYQSPGPVQYFGPAEITDSVPHLVANR